VVKAVSSTEESPAREMVEGAGDAILLLVSRALVETLSRQADYEGVRVGVVLDKAVRAYLEEHGGPEVGKYLQALAEAS
jgi:hypothetical protein